MKICILGSYSGKLDEGMANVSYYLFENLKKEYTNHEFFFVNVNDVLKMKFWKMIIGSKLRIIHYFPGPTPKGLILVKLLKVLTKASTVVSATKPSLSDSFARISKLFAPDIVIVQSQRSELLFGKLNYRTRFIPNGVDTTRFSPVGKEKKCEIRKHFGLSCDDFIVLHIGPARKGRNQEGLLEACLQTASKLILVVSVTNPSEERTLSKLRETEAIIWKKIFKDIENVYAMSDLYVFPVFEELNGIDIPLSVLEAMSCNLPVITSKYGGLTTILNAGEGLFFVENEHDLVNCLRDLREGKNQAVNTRTKVMHSLSWKAVAKEIFNLYLELENLRETKA